MARKYLDTKGHYQVSRDPARVMKRRPHPSFELVKQRQKSGGAGGGAGQMKPSQMESGPVARLDHLIPHFFPASTAQSGLCKHQAVSPLWVFSCGPAVAVPLPWRPLQLSAPVLSGRV